jgi:hypothetical protein
VLNKAECPSCCSSCKAELEIELLPPSLFAYDLLFTRLIYAQGEAQGLFRSSALPPIPLNIQESVSDYSSFAFHAELREVYEKLLAQMAKTIFDEIENIGYSRDEN